MQRTHVTHLQHNPLAPPAPHPAPIIRFCFVKATPTSSATKDLLRVAAIHSQHTHLSDQSTPRGSKDRPNGQHDHATYLLRPTSPQLTSERLNW
jgi:hypothetical protein